MAVVEDDTEINPPINPVLQRYIVQLDDSPVDYAQFFNALGIANDTRSRKQRFKDLKEFRSQPVIIHLLDRCDQTRPDTSKEYRAANYREITHRFMQSRWAHPRWLVTVSHLKSEKERESSLHTRFWPLWIVMRKVMFPESDALQLWDQRRIQAEAEAENRRARTEGPVLEKYPNGPQDATSSPARNLRSENRDLKAPSAMAASDSPRVPDTGAGEDEATHEQIQDRDAHAVQIVGSILRLAAAAAQVSRVKNSMSLSEKWKLRKQLKQLRR